MNGLYGGTVSIDHRNGYISQYGHFQNVDVRVGAEVDTNVKIGNAGHTGLSFGDHLHLNIKQGGRNIDPKPLIGTSYSSKPTVQSSNTKYAVITTNPSNLTPEQAATFGCQMPGLPTDIEPSSDENGSIDSSNSEDYTGDEDNFVEVNEVSSDNIDIGELIETIKNNLGEDFNYYFKLEYNCDWWNAGCHKQNAESIIRKLKEFLEHLINGIKNGLIKAAQNLIEEFQKLFNRLQDLIKDPYKAVQDVINEAKNIWNGIWELINNLGGLAKLLYNNIKDFFSGSRTDRIYALGKAIGIQIGEKIGDSIKGALTGGPVAAIASVIKRIIEETKKAFSFVIKTAQLIGKKIKFGSNKIQASIVKFGFRIGFDFKSSRKLARYLDEKDYTSVLNKMPETNALQKRAKSELMQFRDYHKRMVSYNPNEIRFSQNSTGQKTHNIVESIKNNGWDDDQFISVVRMSDGKLTALDNTRLAAARINNKSLKMVEFAENEGLHATRIPTMKGAKTYGEAIKKRISDQTDKFGEKNPFGSNDLPKF